MQSFQKTVLLGMVLAAAAAQLAIGAVTSHAAPPCAAGSSCSPDAADALQVTVPEGSQPCPSSGLGASCLTSDGGAVTPGTSSTPDGETPCPSTSALNTPAACSDPLAPSTALTDDPAVEPGIPVASIRPAGEVAVSLTSTARAVVSGASVVLTANATRLAMSAGSELEILDKTTGTLAGACGHGTRCAVAYSADAGVHVFQAVVLPDLAESRLVPVGWASVSLATTLTAVGPGRSAILTATSSIPVERFGYTIQLIDATRQAPVTFCSRGTNCSAAFLDPASGTHTFAAAVGPATSEQVTVTWLSATLGASAYRAGGSIHLVASTNADLTGTPWSLGIVDEHGRLVGMPCKTGATCDAEVTTTSSPPGQFTAVVGALPTVRGTEASGAASLVDVQVQSAPVLPARLLWGVDSCKASTGDLYPRVASGLGAPDFWGRYLTPTVCAAISGDEVAMAHSLGMGILPIYNDYDCSNVAGYDTAVAYAHAAAGAAQGLQIPRGRALAIDIEPPGPYCSGAVDAAFVQGWFDGVTAAGYVPLYYGNGTAGSEFASAYCAAEGQNAAIATGSFIWSFEPSLVAPGLSKSRSPGWGPYVTGCPDSVAAWQYQIDVNSPNPDVDLDEALSTLPLWYP